MFEVWPPSCCDPSGSLPLDRYPCNLLDDTPHARHCVDAGAVPTEFRRTGVRSEWADVNRGGVAMDSFLEGPVFDAVGNLYVTDIIFGRVFRSDAKGTWTQIVEYDGEPNGMKFLSETELLITDYKNGLMRLKEISLQA